MSQRLLLVLFIFFLGSMPAQTKQLYLLKKEKLSQELAANNAKPNTKKKRGVGNAMLTLYQKHISVLISADCLYTMSCSRYSREAINKYGLIPGVLLTADRLMRCSAAAGKDIPNSKFNEDGLAEDNP